MVTPSPSAAPRTAILGGGITGLAAAFRLHEARHDFHLYERQSRWGGVLQTERVDGFLLEHGGDMMSTMEPWAIGLCRRLGFESELIGTDDRYRRAFVVRDGRLYPVPEGFTLLQPRKLLPVLRSPLLSWRGKLRLLGEAFVPPRKNDQDESLADFTIRRFGREVFDRLVQPLVGGIYTADPYQLSMAATMGRFRDLERQYGGLIRAVLRSRPANTPSNEASEGTGARYSMFVTPREGMSSLVETIANQLPSDRIHLSHTVERLTREQDDCWKLELRTSDGRVLHERFSRLIVALPVTQAAQLFESVDPSLSELLRKIPVASSAVAMIGVARDQIAHPLDGFGFVVPLCEKRPVLAGSFASVKFAGRAPDGHVLFRIFMGGACQPELLEHDDATLLRLAREELQSLLGMRGTPRMERLIRWDRAMPQYHVGHLDIVSAIERRVEAWPGLALAGNAYRGVGIPFCIRSGEAAADRVLALEPRS